MRFLIQIVAAVALVCSDVALTQTTLATLQSEMVSAWLVTVEGDARTRTLRIMGLTQKDGETFILEAAFGMTEGPQTPVRAELRQSGQERTLYVTTQRGSKIAATQGAGGAFQGTVTPTNGATRGVKIERMGDAELRRKAASIRSGPEIAPPAANVPATCAALLGGWHGTWAANNAGEEWLWVVGVDADCVATYSHDRRPTAFKTQKLDNGVLATNCDPGGGVCYFERDGDDVRGAWRGGGRSNSITLRRVPAPKCADFVGTWAGRWLNFGTTDYVLQVSEVGPDCVAKFAYFNSADGSGTFRSDEIKDGKLAFVCDSTRNGTCMFERTGDDLSASYSNPRGQWSKAVFRKGAADAK